MRKVLFVLAVLISEPLRLVYFSRLGLSTDWLLGLAVLCALSTKPSQGVLIGFVLGAGRDVMYGNPIGFEAMLFSGAAWLVGITGRTVYREAFTTQALMIFVVSLVYGCTLFVQSTSSFEGVFLYLTRSVAPGAIIPSLGIPLVFQLMRTLMRPKLSEDIEALLKESQLQGRR